VANATLQSYVGPLANAYNSAYGSPGNPAFGTPLSSNGVTMGMGTTGGRADIGYTTQENTAWLVTQDARAATLALLQADAGGAVPWNYKLANGHWMTPSDAPMVWTDPRSGPYTTAIANLADDTYWGADEAHQPNLNYVPFIMTGRRWNLDRLNAQAANALTNDWPGERCIPYGSSCNPGMNDLVVNGQDQIRQQAWSLREIEEAAFVGAPSSFEQGYFSQVVTDNWNYINGQETGSGILSPTIQGAAAGWVPSCALQGNPQGCGASWQNSPWMQDYFTGIAALGAEMGSAGALQFINYQKDTWLAARFNLPASLGMNPYDSSAYRLIMTDASSNMLMTWPAIEQATIAQNFSNGNSWSKANLGDYQALSRAALGAAATLYPSDANLQQALTWLNGSSCPTTTVGYFQQDPTFNVVPLQ
jgi:hypothetical protein